MLLLIKGFLIGIAVAAPIGPVGLLCLRRSIVDGKLRGFITGMGAAVADAMMAIVAAFGMTAILSFVEGHRSSFQIAGGAVLMVMGVAAMKAKPPTRTKGQLHTPGLTKAFFSTIVLTLANPVTIGSLLLLFSAFGVSLGTDNWQNPVKLVAGVFLGSAAWWLLLSHFAEWFGRKLNTNLLRSINIGTGVMLCLLGAYQLLCVFMGW